MIFRSFEVCQRFGPDSRFCTRGLLKVFLSWTGGGGPFFRDRSGGPVLGTPGTPERVPAFLGPGVPGTRAPGTGPGGPWDPSPEG